MEIVRVHIADGRTRMERYVHRSRKWSLSIYNAHHFFIKNPINRYSVGTKNKDLKFANDGSLTIYVQGDAPADPVQRANWLPAPKGDFSLYVRSYWPKAEIMEGSWTPPAVQKVG